jgi:hypothetical protein
MKNRFVATFGGPVLVLTVLGTALIGAAPPESKTRNGVRAADSNAVPQSVFTIPSNFGEGRDPFYPNARYMFGTPQVVATRPIAPGADLLRLNGISGTMDRKLAIINFRTMAEGETNDVLTVSGHVRFRCVEIKSQSVVIEVIGGERRELHLPD